MSIYEKLLKIQTSAHIPKSQRNTFGKYNYRSCEDILEGLKPFLLENNAVLYLTDDVVFVEGRFYVKATATLIDIENNERLQVNAFAREESEKKGMDSSQVTGATSSYARKYALNAMFAIDDTKDADTDESQVERQEREKAKVNPAISKMKEVIKSLTSELKQCGLTKEKLLEIIQKFSKVPNGNYMNENDLEILNKIAEELKKLKESV